jgi:hypothetical protein
MEYSPRFQTSGSDLLPTPRRQLVGWKHSLWALWALWALAQQFLSQMPLG